MDVRLVLLVALSLFVTCSALTNEEWNTDVSTNQNDVNRIAEYVQGVGKYKFWDDLAEWTDTFGGRVCGSQALEDSIDFLKDKLETESFDVRTESLQVPGWSRGNESAEMTSPRRQKLTIFGLGGTVGTGPSGIEAEVMIVHDFEELQARADEVPGKIVVFNRPWTIYSTTYRKGGAIEAAKLGAVASAINSLASYSLYSPHTGSMSYEDGVTKIPHIALTVEDADMFERMINRGKTVRMKIILGAQSIPNAVSRHLIAEIKGSTYPDEIVFVGGHLDSWDRGNGVQDDGIGVIMGIEVLRIIKALDLKPKRTVRFIGWTCEEVSIYGSEVYYEEHKDEGPSMSLGMQADHGLFTPVGVGHSGSAQGDYVLGRVLSLLDGQGKNYRVFPGGTSPDSGWWYNNAGVPVVNMRSDDAETAANDPSYKEKYFYYHHTFADHMNAVDKDQLDENQILWTTVTYVVANLAEKLPREDTSGAPLVLPSAIMTSILMILSLL